MRKIFICLPVVLFAVAATWSSCTKDDLQTLTSPDCDTCQTSTCDTTFQISYANDIVPILDAECYECHDKFGSINGDGNVFDTYATFITYVSDGRIMGVITHADGYPPMPDGDPKIADCKIARIEAWIRQGALNN